MILPLCSLLPERGEWHRKGPPENVASEWRTVAAPGSGSGAGSAQDPKCT